MKKREFKECVERLIDREAVSVDVQNEPKQSIQSLYTGRQHHGNIESAERYKLTNTAPAWWGGF